MKRISFIVLLSILYVLPQQLFGQSYTPYFRDYIWRSNIAVNAACTTKAEGITSVPPPADLNWHQGFKLASATGRVMLEVADTTGSCIPDTFTCTIIVELDMYKWDNTHVVKNDTLSVTYNRANGEKFKEKDLVEYDQVQYLKVKVLSISNTSVKQYLIIKNEIEQERYKDMVYNHYPYIGSVSNATDPGNNYILTFTATDMNIVKSVAVEYDIEWMFIEAYKTSGSLDNSTSIPYDFRFNATRVTVSQLDDFRIANIYDKGYLLCRVRAVGRGGTNFDQRIEGPWSLADNGIIPSGQGGDVVISSKVVGYAVGTEHDRALNWQYDCVYAEEAKQKQTITYFDGSLRNRQAQSLVKTDAENYVIIQDNIYDYEGRAAIQTLPVPVKQEALRYIANSVKYSSTQEYTRAHFDQDPSDICESSTKIFDNTSKAQDYYSSGNDWITTSGTNIARYIPQAEGFPFVQTEFMPDNTGRVSKVSAPGLTHKLGNKKETKYLYVTPDQDELDMLFGTEVGYAEHYKKNIVVDANGQASISYLNASGKVIATALTGIHPEGMNPVENIPVIPKRTEDLLKSTYSKLADDALIHEHSFYVPVEDEYEFTYSMNAAKYIPNICPGTESICFDGVYKLDITLQSECDEEKLPGNGVDPITPAPISRSIGNTNQPLQCVTGTVTYSFNLSNDPVLGATDGILKIRLKPGSYTISKTLRIDDEALKYYTEQFLASNTTCKTLSDFEEEALANIDTSGCGLTCVQCNARLGSFADFKSRKFLDLSHTGKDTLNLPADILTQIQKDFDEQKAFCDDLCDTVFDKCDAIEEILKADVSPGGKYAPYTYDKETEEYTITSDAASIFTTTSGRYYKDFSTFATLVVSVGGVNKFVKDLEPKEFIENFEPSWASVIIRNHPEICQLDKCRSTSYLLSESSQFDMKMLSTESYAEAKTKKLLSPLDNSTAMQNPATYSYPLDPITPSITLTEDPFFKSAGCATSTGRNEMWERLTNYKQLTFNTWYLTSDAGDDLLDQDGTTGKYFFKGTTVYAGRVCGLDNTKMCKADPVSGNFVYEAGVEVQLGTIETGPVPNNAYKRVRFNSEQSTVYKLSMWDMPVMTYFCSQLTDGNTKKMNHCVETNRSKIETCPGIQDKFWMMFRALYIANKDYISAADISNGYILNNATCVCNPIIPSGKARSIYQNMQGDNIIRDPQVAPTPTEITDGFDDAGDEIESACADQCMNYADYWMDKLAGCRSGSAPLSETLKGLVKAALIDVCKRGCDGNNTLGSSSVAPANISATEPNSFREVLEKYGIFDIEVCNDLLISMPKAYDHNYFSTQDPQRGDTCACNEKYNEIAPGVTQDLEAPEGVECPCEDVLKDPETKPLMMINTKVDPIYKCNDCISCEQFGEVYTYFEAEYASVPLTSPQFRTLFENYFNQKLSFNLSFDEYARFAGKCIGDTVGSAESIIIKYRDYFDVSLAYEPVNFRQQLTPHNELSPVERMLNENGSAVAQLDAMTPVAAKSYNVTNVIAELHSVTEAMQDACSITPYIPRYGAMYNPQDKYNVAAFKQLMASYASSSMMAPPPPTGNNTYLDNCGCDMLLQVEHDHPGLTPTQLIPYVTAATSVTLSADKISEILNRCHTIFVASGSGGVVGDEDVPDWSPGATWNEIAKHEFFIITQTNAVEVPLKLSCANVPNPETPEIKEEKGEIDCDKVLSVLTQLYLDYNVDGPGDDPYDPFNPSLPLFTDLINGNPNRYNAIIAAINNVTGAANPALSRWDMHIRVPACFDKIACSDFTGALQTFITNHPSLFLASQSYKTQLLVPSTCQLFVNDLNAAYNKPPYFQFFNQALVAKYLDECITPFAYCDDFRTRVHNYVTANLGYGANKINPTLSIRDQLLAPGVLRNNLINTLNTYSQQVPYLTFFDAATLEAFFDRCFNDDFCTAFRAKMDDFISVHSQIDPQLPLIPQLEEASEAFRETLFDELNATTNDYPYYVFFANLDDLEEKLIQCADPFPCSRINSIGSAFVTEFGAYFASSPLPVKTQLRTPAKKWLFDILSSRINTKAALYPYMHTFTDDELQGQIDKCLTLACCVSYRDYSWSIELLNQLLDKYPPSPLNANNPYSTLLTSNLWKVNPWSTLYLANNKYDYIKKQKLRYQLGFISRTVLEATINNKEIDKTFHMGLSIEFDGPDSLEFSWMYATHFDLVKITDQTSGTCDGTIKLELTVTYMANGDPGIIKQHKCYATMDAFPFIRTKECTFDGKIPTLCNQSISPELPQEDCVTQIKNEAKHNALDAYNRYIDDLRKQFRAAYIAKCKDAGEVFTMSYYPKEYHFTLYYYDQAGNLVATVPPEGVDLVLGADQASTEALYSAIGTARAASTLSGSNPTHTLVTTYQYNSLNQLIFQNTPDADDSYFYYDELGRIVFSRNAKQAEINQYSYTKYDGLGRIFEVGQLTTAAVMSHTISRNPTSVAAFLASVGSNFKEVTRTVYDDATGITLPSMTLDNVRNRVVSTSYHPLGTAIQHAAYYSYDIHGNVKRLIRHIPALDQPEEFIDQGYKTVDYAYDLISGKVNTVTYQDGKADQYIHQYVYDAENRIIEARSGTRPAILEADATYYYYMHGPLARVELGDKKVQGVDYAYTIHGWLKAVNSTTLWETRDMGKDGATSLSGNIHTNIARDVYGFALHYYEGDYKPVSTITYPGSFLTQTDGSVANNSGHDLFNGNIRMMVTAISKFMETASDPPLASAYTYDQLNRIKQAEYFNNFTVSSTENKLDNTGAAMTDYKNTFVYDGNGNIQYQFRNGASSAGVDMDDLQYVYDTVKKNRLKRVIDRSNNINGYSDDMETQADVNNYDYDKIGNLTQDLAEEIQKIDWTVYGKIKRITRTTGSKRPDLEFEYTPDGHRAVKIVIPKLRDKQARYTYYVRDVQGNIMATYDRVFNKIVDYDTLNYTSVNDSIIASGTLETFAGFISTLHKTYTQNSGLNNHTELRLDSVTQQLKDFLYANQPNELLMGDATLYAQTLGGYDPAAFIHSIVDQGVLLEEEIAPILCNCMSEDVENTFLLWTLSDPLAREYFFRTLYIHKNTDYKAVMSYVGCPQDNSPGAFTCLAAAHTEDLWDKLRLLGYDECSGQFNDIYAKMAVLYNTQFYSIMASVPDVKKMLGSFGSYSCSGIDQNTLITALSGNYMWDVIMQYRTPALLVQWFKTNQLDKYLYTVAYQHKNYIGDYQNAHNMYSSEGNGMAAYFEYIRKYFDQSFYDNLRMKFYNKSRAYCDSLNLQEWFIYGSSRIGSYNAHLNLVTIKYYADTNELGQTTDTVYISSKEQLLEQGRGRVWRGIRRYELSNHLGNVLVVISDKKTWNCAGSYYQADVIQATDYSPFGAPLADRTWNLRMVLNNQFTSTTQGWTANSGSPTVSEENGKLKITATGTCEVQKQITTVPGKVYELFTDLDKGTFGGFQVGIYEIITTGTSTSIVTNKVCTTSVNGKQVVYFKAASTSMYIRLMPQTAGSGSQTAYVNFIRIKQVEDEAFARNFTYEQNLTVTSRTGNTPALYNATGTIIFDDGFESAASDVFETVIEQMTLVSDLNEEGGYRFGFNGQEKDDEVSGAGNSYTAEFWQYDPRLGRRFNPDPKPTVWESVYAVLRNNPLMFTDLRGDTPTAAESAVMQDFTYSLKNSTFTGQILPSFSKVKLIGGWEAMQKVSDKKSGFKSALFRRSLDGGGFEYAYVFAGTDDWGDVKTDAGLYLGNKEQMTMALKYATQFSKDYSGSEMTYVGHSLGGWLASGAAMKTGHPAITFNAPGISFINQMQYGLDKSTAIKAYVVQGEVLNYSLSKFGLGATGAQTLLRTNSSFILWKAAFQSIEGHMMSTVITKLKEEGMWHYKGEPALQKPSFDIFINKPDAARVGN